MSEAISVSKEHYLDFTVCKRNHIWVYLGLSVFQISGRSGCLGSKGETMKNFIFDTGAQNTILSRKRAESLGYMDNRSHTIYFDVSLGD
jgi:hypothetical protein